MYAAGIAVQRPVALFERRRRGMVRTGVYVGEYAADATSIAQWMQEHRGPDEREALLAMTAVELRRMHDGGFIHNDLKTGNLLIQRVDDHWRPLIIDLEGVSEHRRMTPMHRAVDLARLWLALEELTMPSERVRWLERYAAVDPPLDLEELRRAIDRRIEEYLYRWFDRLPEIGARLRPSGESTTPVRRWLIILLGTPEETQQLEPLLTLLRTVLPRIEVELLISDRTWPQVAGRPEFASARRLGEEWGAVFSTMRALRAQRYDTTIDLTGTLRSAVLTMSTSAPVRIGFRNGSSLSKWGRRLLGYTNLILTRTGPRRPSLRYLLVAEALGIRGAP